MARFNVSDIIIISDSFKASAEVAVVNQMNKFVPYLMRVTDIIDGSATGKEDLVRIELIGHKSNEKAALNSDGSPRQVGVPKPASWFEIATDEQTATFKCPELKAEAKAAAAAAKKAAVEEAKEAMKAKGLRPGTITFKNLDQISLARTGKFTSNINDEKKDVVESDPEKLVALTSLYNAAMDAKDAGTFDSFSERQYILSHAECAPIQDTFTEEAKKEKVDFFFNFCRGLNWAPSPRMMNTLVRTLCYPQDLSEELNTVSKVLEKAKGYVFDYFQLKDHPYLDNVKESIKSPEFKNAMIVFSRMETEKKINDRIKVFFGEPGTGKTTKALAEIAEVLPSISGAPAEPQKIGAAANMEIDDLLYAFDFLPDGTPVFKPGNLILAMRGGYPIVIDEINLLSTPVLAALQSYLDSSEAITTSKGDTIKIKEGFQIFATMNLAIGGQVHPLPEAIVDRCFWIEEFKTSAEYLLKAAF